MLRAKVDPPLYWRQNGPQQIRGECPCDIPAVPMAVRIELLVRRGRTFALACADTRVEVLKGIPVRQVQERTGNVYAFRGDITAFG